MSDPFNDQLDDAFARAINAIDDAMLLVRELKKQVAGPPQERIPTEPDLSQYSSPPTEKKEP